MNIEFEKYYERCRALIYAIGLDGVSENDRMALIAVLEDEFKMLGSHLSTMV